MSSDNYIGIDYGLGQTNVDKTTGIRYGVIAQHSCCPEAVDDIMTHGEDIAFKEAKREYLEVVVERVHHWFNDHSYVKDGTEKEKRIRFTDLLLKRLIGSGSRCLAEKVARFTTEDWGETSTREEIIADAEAAVDDHFGDHYDSDGGLRDYCYEQNGYLLTGCLETDIMVARSKYYTYAQFCSPCVPGAGNLDHPLPAESGAARTYCLGHDWFEKNKAPYRMWRVEDGVELVSTLVKEPCPSCKGTGRDTAQRLAEIRGCAVEDVSLLTFQNVDHATRTFSCLRCDGTGEYTHTDETEGPVDPNFKQTK